MNFRRIITAGAITGMIVVTGCASNVPSNNEGNRNGERLTQAINRNTDNDVRRNTDITRGIGVRRDNDVRRDNLLGRDNDARRDSTDLRTAARTRNAGTPGAVTANNAASTASRALYVNPEGRRVVEPVQTPATRNSNSIDLRRDSLNEDETVPASLSTVRPVTARNQARNQAYIVPSRHSAQTMPMNSPVHRVHAPRVAHIHAQNQINAHINEQVQAHINSLNSRIRQQNLDRQQTAVRNRHAAAAALGDENRTTSNREDVRARRDAIVNSSNFDARNRSAGRMGGPRRAARHGMNRANTNRIDSYRNENFRDDSFRNSPQRDDSYRNGSQRNDSYKNGSYRNNYHRGNSYRSQDFRGYKNNNIAPARTQMK